MVIQNTSGRNPYVHHKEGSTVLQPMIRVKSLLQRGEYKLWNLVPLILIGMCSFGGRGILGCGVGQMCKALLMENIASPTEGLGGKEDSR
jgi:hypothetical protein